MPHRIFLIEDNPLIRDTMTDMLADIAGAQVVAWADAEAEAIEAMGKADWDVALVDLFLARGSGLGVAKAFSRRKPSQRLYVVTNYATVDIRERCAKLGIDGIFDKSTELDRLLAVLQGGKADEPFGPIS